MEFSIIRRLPFNCSQIEIDYFENLVKIGGEVDQNGLRDRIKNALLLVWASTNNGNVVGITALKKPNENYRSYVFKKAGCKEKPILYEAELGWMFVREEYRGKGLATRLMTELLSETVPKNIYATVRENNCSMLRILRNFEFQQSGNAYESNRGDYSLVLYKKQT